MLEIGDVIAGRLRIERLLGAGGMGIVAAATHLELRQSVAVKMLLPRFANDPTSVERFLREARAVAVLRTEHVCRVFDAGRTDDGAPYIVMELLEGAVLGSLIKHQPLPAPLAVDYVLQTCMALAEAHARGIVHRDLKPSNLFVVRRPDGRPLVKVLDFGIAKVTDELRLTHSAAMLGSPAYMSPEQLLTPRDVDARTDIWSLGVTLYQLLTGTTPYPSTQFAEIAMMITSEAPRPIEIDAGLRTVIWRCLEKDRNARYPDVAALAAALTPFVGPARRPRRRAMKIGSIALASMLVGGGVLAGYVARGDASSPAATAAVPRATATVAAIGPVAVERPAPPPTPAIAKPTAPAEPPAPAPPITKPTAPAEPPAARETAAPAPPITKPTAPAATKTDAPKAEKAKRAAGPGNAIALAQTEATIRESANHPEVLPSLYMAAAALACGVPDAARARAHYAKLSDPKLQHQAREVCRIYRIEL